MREMLPSVNYIDPQAGKQVRVGANKMIDTLPRPELSADEYRECEVLAMQIMIQLPHHDKGKCLVIRDICTNIHRRWLDDERMHQHRPFDAMAEMVNSNIVKLAG